MISDGNKCIQVGATRYFANQNLFKTTIRLIIIGLVIVYIYIFLCHVHAFRIKRHYARVCDLSSNILQRQIVTFITIIANFLAFQSIQCCSIIIIIVVINIMDDYSGDAVAVVAATPIDHPLFHIYCVNLTFGILIQLWITFKRSWRTDLQIDL